MSYFLHDGHNQLGPYSLDELRQKQLKPNTPVWKDGLSDWTMASEIEELKGMVSGTPPVFNGHITATPVKPLGENVSLTERVGWKLGKTFGWSGLLVILLIIGIVIYNKANSHSYIPYSGSVPAIDQEHANPASFLYASGTYHQNFWGNKEDLTFTVKNSASHTNYKDIRVKVTFFSQTNSVITTQEYILYDYVPYGSTKQFSLKINKPSAAVKVVLDAVGATYY